MIPLDEFAPPADLMPAVLERFQSDRDALQRLCAIPYSPWRRQRLREFLTTWRDALDELAFERLSRSDRLDWILFRNMLAGDLERCSREEHLFAEMEPLLPFAAELIALEEERRRLREIDPEAAAERLHRVRGLLLQTRRSVEVQLPPAGRGTGIRRSVAYRAAATLARIRGMLGEWFAFYHGYDPAFTWWVEQPYQALLRSLEEYGDLLQRQVAGAEGPEVVVGDPVGREALEEALRAAFLSYAPEELIRIGRREMEWCRAEMARAARAMGYADWREALERVKNAHVPPGRQPALVRELAFEAIRYVEEHDLVTVPPLAREGWQMGMMSPERQKVNPFFLGGETIIVSFPTNRMGHDEKRMSLRGNNRAFARATVHHELIPGHYLQCYSEERHRPYRRLFSTPFWIEGWPLHWEMLLWDLGFAETPEEQVGMLFWRMHRCARVVFSLRFHLGEMTPQECIAMLVDEVGHEPENAAAEVRRSFQGGYDPLYQCAYLLGGLQLRALHRELVGAGRMTQRQFHDAVLRENSLPIAALRALLLGLPLERGFAGEWRFYPEV